MRRLIFTLTLLGTFAFTGCTLNKMIKMAEEQELTVSPDPLEVHGDSVEFEVSAALPVKMLKEGKTYTVLPTYEYEGQERELEGIDFTTDQFPNSDDQQPRVTETYTFAYDPDMGNGGLYVRGIAKADDSDKMKESDKLKIADGLVTTSRLVRDSYYSNYADHGYNNQEELVPTEIDFYFQQGSSYLRPSEKRSNRGDNFQNFIAEKNVTRTVTITGTHSPEGSERINENLSEDRARAIENWYRQQMRRYDYQGMADSIEFILKPVVLDWEPFKVMMQEYDGISESEKQEYMNIINGSGSYEDKEDQMHQLPTYNKVFRELYPELRRAKTEVLTVMEKKSDAEISVLAKGIAEDNVDIDTLSNEELGYAVTLTPDLEEREEILNALNKKADNYVSHNNLGAVYLEMAEKSDSESQMEEYVEKAINQFEMANQKQENAESYMNLATAYMMQGRNDKARDVAAQGSDMQMTTEDNTRGSNGVRGVIAVKSGDYDEAINLLSSANETAVNKFNLALAQVLSEDYRNALTTIEDVMNMEDAQEVMGHAHYLAAIANARLQQEDQVYEHLTQAIQADSDLREKAMDDLEFRNYSESEQFKNSLM
ncbi:MAG: OmpA family protein [Cyclobacteriaceae bacterium]